jgi:hypothetical protein
MGAVLAVPERTVYGMPPSLYTLSTDVYEPVVLVLNATCTVTDAPAGTMVPIGGRFKADIVPATSIMLELEIVTFVSTEPVEPVENE